MVLVQFFLELANSMGMSHSANRAVLAQGDKISLTTQATTIKQLDLSLMEEGIK